ncbi:MAG: NAD(P)/FAD-dependent oxidoreductase [Lachnospiraceae bacterium]
MIRIRQLKMNIAHTPQELEQKIRRSLKLAGKVPVQYSIVRRSVDARHKDDKKYVYTLDVRVPAEQDVLKRSRNSDCTIYTGEPYRFPASGLEEMRARPVVVGSGPAGLFSAYFLAQGGYRPIVLERGACVQERIKCVEDFWAGGRLNLQTNVQFGEGGAGTFSDGKLNTLVKDPRGRNRAVLQVFVDCGAPEEILYDQKPHLGTDLLVTILKNMREKAQAAGCEFRFLSQVTDLRITDGSICGVEVTQEADTPREQRYLLPADTVILAPGHSARDTFRLLCARGVQMQPKAFAVGFRIEHPQRMMNQALWGEAENKELGPASYKLTHTSTSGRGVYSFCMCPGGYVVNASSETGRLAINGMSYQDRAGENANSALIVTISQNDFADAGVLAGVEFQEALEHSTYALADGAIPVQLYADFCAQRQSTAVGEIQPQMKGRWAFADLSGLLPAPLSAAIQEAVKAFGRKIPGFDRPDAVLSAIESRTSSPVRLLRNAKLESNIAGLYPCGEGAGYAGGITSAAMDGVKVAEAVAARYAPF